MDCIRECTKCSLYKNQRPLLELKDHCDIMWIGLSAKKSDNISDDIPLSPLTKSGKIVEQLEKKFYNLTTYKTNLVKCLPLDTNGKIRYPSKSEIESCVGYIEKEIALLKPKLVIMLGEKVSDAITKYYDVEIEPRENDFEYSHIEINGVFFISVQHPSYMAIYKRSRIFDYGTGINNVIANVF